ncbi:MAG: amino acid ABC transporter substrate-binding protein [Alphaproteobacteria bacterium]|nr:amino acid ABC transporter substrate-binding protein [Alphaproteobacteria bacterium]
MRFGKFAHFALGLSLVLGISLTATRPAQSETLDSVKQRGFLLCGVSAGVSGFSTPSADGGWSGFDVDFCRALAAAIFDDVSKVRFVPLNATERYPALQAGTIDVLSRNSSWTISTEAGLNLIFAATTFYDGQGFMVRRSRNAATAEDLANTKVCVQAATTSEQNAVDYFKTNGMAMELVARPTAAEVLAAYEKGACDVMTSDVSALYGERLKLEKPDEHVILPDVISKEALGPVVRGDDLRWFEIVKWTHFAMVDAEELGVATNTLDAALGSAKPDVRRLIGRDAVSAEKLGLNNDFAARIIRHVGNYAEVYDRNLGSKTQLGIPRGINELWSRGGILYAPPMR